jgi:arylsulfatase A-like enzyme
MGSGKNIVMVVFDSLRKDCVGAFGQPPWGEVETPNLDALASESRIFTRAYAETLPTLPARRAMYTGMNVYPFHGGDFKLRGDSIRLPGWGPIPEDQDTLAELLRDKGGYRTALISDVYHMFKPSKNYWRGFDQWTFLRGQESDPERSGPHIPDVELGLWMPQELADEPKRASSLRQTLKNMRGRLHEEDYFAARVMTEAVRWLEENGDADKFFLTVESFDPHEPWFVPEHYRRMYDDSDGPERIQPPYGSIASWAPEDVRRSQAAYSGLITMCDRWFGRLHRALKDMGLLEDTLLVVTADHGHSMGEEGYMGKRPYPADPAVFEVPLMLRQPEGVGDRSESIVQHTDIAATVLDYAGVEFAQAMDGRSLLGEGAGRDHATVAYGSAVVVVDSQWWLNAKVDGTGAFLYDLDSPDPRAKNLADERPEVADRLFSLALNDARGGFPEYLMTMANELADATGSSSRVLRGA